MLGAVALAGMLSVALVAPNAVRLLAPLERGLRRKMDPKYAASYTFRRLIQRGLIQIEETERGKFARLTQKGELILRQFDRTSVRLKKPKRWDGKWRILIFDIKEQRRWVRDRLRITLVGLGFLQLQRSVWVYPYDCEDFVTLMKADFHAGSEILYVVADRIENDGKLRWHFNLAS